MKTQSHHARHPTLRDVADLAGVSIKTASRVVNGEPGVVETKVDAVRRAVTTLNYRPNLSASGLRRTDGRTAAVGAILQNVANPYSAEVLRALEDAARAEGVLVFSGSVDEDPAREHELVRAFAGRRADGLVLMPSSLDHTYLDREFGPAKPTIFVDRPPRGRAADAVVVDNRGASRRAVAHLVAHGHRTIAFLGDQEQISTARERYDGYRDALEAAGLESTHHDAFFDLHDDASVVGAVARLLAGPRPPTALFSAQNKITMATVRALHRLGRQRAVALVGFDDFPMADVLSPAVTVVRQDSASIGRHAARMLFARLSGDTSPFETVVVEAQLIARGSGEIPPPGGTAGT